MTDFIHCALPDSLSFFIYVFQQLPNRALSDEGCAIAEADQLYHYNSISETTLTGSKRKAREKPTNCGTQLLTVKTRAPTDGALILYEATNSRKLLNTNHTRKENTRLTRLQTLPNPTH
jgi:hypothetical protein